MRNLANDVVVTTTAMASTKPTTNDKEKSCAETKSEPKTDEFGFWMFCLELPLTPKNNSDNGEGPQRRRAPAGHVCRRGAGGSDASRLHTYAVV